MHEPKHSPATGTGWQVCECGATRRIENGYPVGSWHTCKLCVLPNAHKVTDEDR